MLKLVPDYNERRRPLESAINYLIQQEHLKNHHHKNTSMRDDTTDNDR